MTCFKIIFEKLPLLGEYDSFKTSLFAYPNSFTKYPMVLNIIEKIRSSNECLYPDFFRCIFREIISFLLKT